MYKYKEKVTNLKLVKSKSEVQQSILFKNNKNDLKKENIIFLKEVDRKTPLKKRLSDLKINISKKNTRIIFLEKQVRHLNLQINNFDAQISKLLVE